MMDLPDVQKQTEGFPHITLENVGVEHMRTLLPVRCGSAVQRVQAVFDSYCSLHSGIKGINMSRIGRTIRKEMEMYEASGLTDLGGVARELIRAHGSETEQVRLVAAFDIAVDRAAPVSGTAMEQLVPVKFMSVASAEGSTRNYLSVTCRETSLCPCSKEMSLLTNNITPEERQELEGLSPMLRDKVLRAGFGAHNQISEVTITLELMPETEGCSRTAGADMALEMADIIRESVSAPTFPVLRRPDEKWVTETAYLGGVFTPEGFRETGGGPAFVEDIARRTAARLEPMLDSRIADFMIRVRNQESIHSDGILAAAVTTAHREFQPNFI